MPPEPAEQGSFDWSDRRLVAGIDEAGRGPLAGPVVAAAVVLDRFTQAQQGTVLL